MTHPRETIRTNAVAVLEAQVATLASRVFRSRVWPLQRDELPGACVYTRRETSQQGALNGLLDRTLDLIVDLYCRADGAGTTGGPDAALDDLAETVETALAADPTLSGAAVDSWLAETAIGFDGQGENANGLAQLVYKVRYRTKDGQLY